MSFDLTKIGEWVESDDYIVSVPEIAAYAAAINDTNPRHLRGELEKLFLQQIRLQPWTPRNCEQSKIIGHERKRRGVAPPRARERLGSA